MEENASLIYGLASCPATSFHEEMVAEFILAYLKDFGLEADRDSFGNIITKYQKGEARDTMALVAHMDHPGLEIIEANGNAPRSNLLGGVRPEYFQKDVSVRIFSGDKVVPGVIKRCTPAQADGLSVLDLETQGQVKVGDFGVWDIDDFQERDGFFHLRAADDLAGCGAALGTLRELSRAGATASVYAVFTRAEEVGLIGATLVAKEGLLPKDTIIVSLESSRELPGAQIGEGPVIRVGDARSTFHPEAERFLLAARDKLIAEDPSIKIQRQLMSGGTCEATAFSVFGYRSTGIAFPLGNYHNMSEGNELKAEYISSKDFDTGISLLVKAAQEAAAPGENTLMQRFITLSDRYRSRMML
ncbi:MAG: M20/M25/M40 family metallo-hydrolase [Dehalococcoidia bacterium]|nr:M20/M25/M40 family metallo-hydrolase [Dehalococcoidia bacterium]